MAGGKVGGSGSERTGWPVKMGPPLEGPLEFRGVTLTGRKGSPALAESADMALGAPLGILQL
jgi:hypothetical protein